MISPIDALKNKIVGYYDLGVIKLPIPKESQEESINSEFIDILGRIAFPPESDLNIVYNEGEYESDNVKLESGDVVIDAGANLGLFSALAGSKGCVVYAFDPNESNIDYIYSMLKLNPKFNVNVINKALFSSDMMIKLYCSNVNPEYSTLYENMFNRAYTKYESTMVEAISLDSFVSMNDIRVDFIKADIEGAEVDLLLGAYKTISEFKPKLSICTYHRPTDKKVISDIINGWDLGYNIEYGTHKIYAWVNK